MRYLVVTTLTVWALAVVTALIPAASEAATALSWALTLLVVALVIVGIAALIGRSPALGALRGPDSGEVPGASPSGSNSWVIATLVLTLVAITTAQYLLRPDRPEFYLPAVPAAPEGADPLSYSDDMTSWCGEQGTEGLADRFGVAPTAEAAAWAVANEAHNPQDVLWWNAAYEGCLRGLRSRQ